MVRSSLACSCKLHWGAFTLHQPEKNYFLLHFLKPSPPRQTDKKMWNGLKHFLIDFTEIFAAEVFSSAFWVVWHHQNQMIFFSAKSLWVQAELLWKDVRGKAYLTTALSLEYITPGPCFSDSVLLSAAVNNTLTNIFSIWARGASLDNPLPARSLLFLILLPVKIILLDFINCSSHHGYFQRDIILEFLHLKTWFSFLESFVQVLLVQHCSIIECM